MPFADPLIAAAYSTKYARQPKRAAKRRAYYVNNREQLLDEMARYRADNPERFRAYRTTQKYKSRRQEYRNDPEKVAHESPIEIPDRPRPLVCECCGTIPLKRRVHFDHCHETGRFLGWCCHTCNTGAGLANNPLLLRKRLAYLSRPLQPKPIRWAMPTTRQRRKRS